MRVLTQKLRSATLASTVLASLAAFGNCGSTGISDGESSNGDVARSAPVPTVPGAAPGSPRIDGPPAHPALPAEGLVAPLSAGARLEDERNTIAVFQAAAPGTVFVTQTRIVRDMFSLAPLEVKAGTGTGFVWDKEGHIVTNFHVIMGDGRGVPPRLIVTLHNQKQYPVKKVAPYQEKDIAVLTIDAPPQELIPIARPPDDYQLDVGQKAIAIGNPFGLDQTLTTGVVSALGREVEGIGGVKIRDMVQTDAAINPGNSGGPLLDSQGRLIGMNTMIFSKSGTSAGIGFAVPVKTIAHAVPQLIKTGRAPRIGIGVSVVDDSVARRNGILGVVLSKIESGSPAARAGLKGLRYTDEQVLLGDVIVGVNDRQVRSVGELHDVLAPYEVGDTVTIVVRREGNTLQIPVNLTDVGGQ